MTQAPARSYIATLQLNARFSGTFSIANAQLGVTKNGDPFLRCLLGDKTGQVPARRWKMDPEAFKRLPTDGFVYVEGQTQPYQGELQLIVDRIEPYEPTDEDLAELLPSSSRPIPEMFDELRALLGTLEHPSIKALVELYLEDADLMAAFCAAPAAKQMHHAFIGGLLEHTLQLCNLANVICPLYPKINRDIVVTGLFLHDLGKTRELSWSGAFSYTDRGELVGHIVEGAIMLHDKAQQLMAVKGVRLPAKTLTVLQHIILSHHTEPEYGAAKVPSTPEAVLVALLDNLDARTAIALDAARPDEGPNADLGGNFTERQWALGTRLFRPDPLA